MNLILSLLLSKLQKNKICHKYIENLFHIHDVSLDSFFVIKSWCIMHNHKYCLHFLLQRLGQNVMSFCQYINPQNLQKLSATKVLWALPLVKLLVDWRLSDLPGLIPPREVSCDVTLVDDRERLKSFLSSPPPFYGFQTSKTVPNQKNYMQLISKASWQAWYLKEQNTQTSPANFKDTSVKM